MKIAPFLLFSQHLSMRVCFSAEDESPISQLNTKTASLIAPTLMHIKTNLIRAVSVFYYRLYSIYSSLRCVGGKSPGKSVPGEYCDISHYHGIENRKCNN